MRTKLLTVFITTILLSYHTFSQEANWEKVTDIKGAHVNKIIIDNKGTIYSLTKVSEGRYSDGTFIERAKLYSSTDNGANWIAVPGTPAELEDIVLADDKLVGVGGNTIYWYNTQNGEWLTEKVVDDNRYNKIYYLGNGVCLLNAVYSFAIYSSITKEITSPFLYVSFKDIAVSNEFIYGINSGNQIMRIPVQSNISNYAPNNWEVLFSNGYRPIYDIEIAGDRVVAAYESDFVAGVAIGFRTAYITHSAPQNWITIPLPFSSDPFQLGRGSTLNVSPTGKMFLSYLGVSVESGTQSMISRMCVLNTTTWSWENSMKYPGASLAASRLTTGLVWKNEQEVFAGTDGTGVLRSIDGGNVWSARNGTGNNSLNDITSGQLFKVGAGRLLFVSGSLARGYYYSDNNGETWKFYTPYINGQPLTFLSFCSLSNSGLLANTTENGFQGKKIVYSADGLNWSYKNENIVTGSLGEVNGRVFSIYGNTIMYSNDLGATWINAGLSQQQPDRFAILDDYIFFQNRSDSSRIIRVNTSTTPWTAKKIITTRNRVSGMFVMNSKLYYGDYDAFYVSDNAGGSFTKTSFPHAELVPVRENSGGIALIKRTTCTITQDDGQSFNNTPTPLAEWGGFLQTNTEQLLTSSLYGPVLRSQQSLIKQEDQLPDKITSDWIRMDGLAGGNVNQIFTANNVLYSVSYNTLYRFDDTQNKWVRLYSSKWPEQFQPSLTVTFDPTDGRLFLSNGFELLKLDPQRLSLQSLFNSGGEVYKNASGIFMLSGGSRINKSTDEGSSFTPVLQADRIYSFIEINGTLFATIQNNGIYQVVKSGDGGSTWSQTAANISFNLNGSTYFNLSATTTGAVYLATETQVYKTSDGINWALANLPSAPTNYIYNIEAVSISASKLFLILECSEKNYLYLSTDAGTSWTLIRDDLRVSSLVPYSNKILIGTRTSGVLQSTDDGRATSVFAANNGYYGYFNKSFDMVNDNLLLNNDKSFAYSNDKGVSWNSDSKRESVFVFDDEVLSYQLVALYRSINNGMTWDFVSSFPGHRFQFLTRSPQKNYFSIYSSWSEQNVLSYSTALQSWSAITNNLTVNQRSQVKALEYLDGYLYVLENGNIHKGMFNVANKSVTFEKIPNLEPIEKLILKDGTFYAFSKNGIIYSTKNGTAWTSQLCPTADSFYLTDLKYFFITSTSGSSFVSRDEGNTWQRMSFTEANNPINIVLDKKSGYGYLALADEFVFKSSQVLIKNDKQTPTLTSLVPAHLASDVNTDYKIELRFSESVFPIAGKQIRIFEQGNLSAPVEVIDVSQGIRNDNTYVFTPQVANVSSKSYFVLVDPGSFIDLYNELYTGITTVFQWSYAMQDVTPPQITHVPVNLQKGSLARLQVEVADNNVVPSDKTKIFYRGITKPSTETFSPAVLLALSGVGTNNLRMEISLPESAYDAMGIEYYFESEDAKGNKVRNPLAENTFYYSYIEYPVPNQPKLNQALSFGGGTENYRIVSFPYKFADSTTSVVLKTLQPYDRTRWRMYGYADDKTFNENPEFIERGRGYWMNVRNPIDVFLEGAKNPVNNKKSFYTIELKPGWNLVGNPYPTPISWNEVKSTFSEVGTIKIFGGNGYENGDVLSAHQGGFVFVNGKNDLNIKVRFRYILTGGRIGNPRETVTDDNWILPLLVQSANSQSSIGGIGMKADAQNGFDNHDDLNPPSFFNYCQIESTDDLTYGLAKSVVASAEDYVWSFVVKSNSNEQTKLSWDLNITSALSRELYLFDVTSQTLVDMRTCSVHNLTGNNFRIYYGEQLDEKIKPTMASLHVTPNPATDFVEVSYSLPDSEVYTRIELIDQIGRTVEILENGILQSGFYKQKVNISLLGQNIYIVRMSTRSANGNSVISKKLLKLQ